MLNFTGKSHQQSNQNFDQINYEPLVITNGGGKQKIMPQTKKSLKKIIKAHSNSVGKKKHSQRRTEKNFVNKQWDKNEQPTNLFDNKLKKNSLASEERRMKAQRSKAQREESIMKSEDKRYDKKFKELKKDKDDEIEKLKRLIERERVEKERNDMLYEEQKRKIEKERKELIKLEEKIQKEGPRKTKQVKQKIRQLDKQIYPANDRAKCHQQYQDYKRKEHVNQVTQSQSLANQKNMLRQKQLQYLIDQRQKNHLQYQKNTLGYTPTLVPLLSRASYKIVSTHISSLVELFIDDLLEEQVYLLEKIQLEEKAQKQREKQQNMLKDYTNKLQQFIDDTERIEDRMGRYDQMKFEDLYIPKRYEKEERRSAFDFSQQNLFKKLQLNLSYEQLEEIESRRDRFKRFTSNFDEYKERNMKMFAECTEQLIDEAVYRLTKELQNGSNEFVDVIFRNEFS